MNSCKLLPSEVIIHIIRNESMNANSKENENETIISPSNNRQEVETATILQKYAESCKD